MEINSASCAVFSCMKIFSFPGTEWAICDIMKEKNEAGMKNYNQVYVKNSFEAAKMYCAAFGAEITREFLNEDGKSYAHCELSVDGEGFLALAEAKNPCNVETVHANKWDTMTFNVFEMGSREKVDRAFSVLSDGGAVLEPIHELPWSAYCATVIDRYGVCWWISI